MVYLADCVLLLAILEPHAECLDRGLEHGLESAAL